MGLIYAISYGQNEHLSFMGVPIDGTIAQFERRLITKGMTPRNEVNKKLPVGQRTYKGIYMGYTVDYITVYYSHITKIVYKIEVNYGSEGSILIDKIEKEFVERTKLKYADCALHNKPSDYSTDYQFFIHDMRYSNSLDWENCIGTIKVNQQTYWRQPSTANHIFNSEKATKYYILQLSFVDKINNERYEREVRDNL